MCCVFLCVLWVVSCVRHTLVNAIRVKTPMSSLLENELQSSRFSPQLALAPCSQSPDYWFKFDLVFRIYLWDAKAIPFRRKRFRISSNRMHWHSVVECDCYNKNWRNKSKRRRKKTSPKNATHSDKHNSSNGLLCQYKHLEIDWIRFVWQWWWCWWWQQQQYECVAYNSFFALASHAAIDTKISSRM